MYIKSLEYHDIASGWQLELLRFSPLTLLVGASGVGKTQILSALLNLKDIANGSERNGIKWAIEFDTDNEHQYRWEGEFENLGLARDLYKFKKENDENIQFFSKIVYEKLILNNEEILSRNQTGIIFESKQTVQLPHHQSVLQLLKEEEKVSHANKGFRKVHFSSNSLQLWILKPILSKEHSSLESLRESQQHISYKLHFTYLYDKEVFEKIKTNFLSIFPHVEDLKIAPFEEPERQNSHPFFEEIPIVIQFKEKGIKHWIHQGKMSSGMFRSLKHLAEIYLCAKRSVILIDEFENSLGINCIDAVTDHLVNPERTLQFIITSHHPYIINHIPFKYWKVVTRQAGKVMTHDASELNLGKSKHEAFIQLLNLDEYTEGIAT